MATPLKKDMSIDVPRVGALVDHLIEGGVDGLLPLGTSGEFALLTRDERKLMIEAVVDRTNGRVPVYAGVSDPSEENVVQFAIDAEDAGADGVISTPPFYYTTTNDGLTAYYERLAEKMELPLMVYNIPAYTKTFVPPEIVRLLAEKELIVGMKYTAQNFLNLLRFLEELRDYDIAIFTGSDAIAYSALEFGGAGAIIGVTNVAPSLSSKIFDDYQSGNLEAARETQLRLLPLIKAITVGKFPTGLKEAMRLAGFPVGPAKEPLPRPSSDETEQIKRYLKEAGDFS